MRQRITCPCGDWEWREVTVLAGLAAVERHCPRCNSRVLLLFRGPEFISGVQFGGSHERPIEVALREARMTDLEIDHLLALVRLLAAS